MNTIQSHYAAPDLLSRITRGLAALGESPATVEVDTLGAVDEFHLGGAAATGELVELLGAGPGDHVLDVGAGLGGPARHLARATGCRVMGIDLSPDFCAAGNRLSAWTGLADRVRLEPGDAADLGRYGPAAFDGAWSIHVGMNLEHKTPIYAEIARVLKPGAPLVIYDLLAAGAGGPRYPTPWASRPEQSFLATRDEMAAHLAAAGFSVVEVRDRTREGTALLEEAFARAEEAGGPPALGIHLIMGAGSPERMTNVREGLASGRLAPTVIAARRVAAA